MRRYSRGDLTGAERKVHLSQPAGTVFPNTESVDFHCNVCTLLSHVHLPAHQDLPHTLMPSSFSLVGSKTFTSAHRVKIMYFHSLNFISRSLEFPLSGSTTTPYFCQLAESALSPVILVFKENGPSINRGAQSLTFPAEFCGTDHNLLSPATPPLSISPHFHTSLIIM